MGRSMQCTAITKKGLRCANAAAPGSVSCSIAAHYDQRLSECDWLPVRGLPAVTLQCLAITLKGGRCPNPAQPDQNTCRLPGHQNLDTLGPCYLRGNLLTGEAAVIDVRAALTKIREWPDVLLDLIGPAACLQQLPAQQADASKASSLVLPKPFASLPTSQEGPPAEAILYRLSEIYWLTNVLDFAQKIDRTSGLFYDPGRDRLSVASSLPPLMTLRSQMSCGSGREVLVVDLNEDHDLWSFLVSICHALFQDAQPCTP